MRLFLLSLALALASPAAALADAAVRIAAPPDWVKAAEAVPRTPTPAGDVSYGFDYLRLDRQVNVREQSSYSHTIYRITTEGALQSGARLTWDYDPAYERLTLHHLRVIRDGAVQERLKDGLVKTLQRESDLERHLLNGESTALVLLDDIRVGDVIDYAFTRQGWNPTFGGRYFANIDCGWSVPVRQQSFRLLAPAGRRLLHQAHGGAAVAPTPTRQGDDELLSWEARDMHPREADGELPAWFEAYPFMQFSEWGSWGDVVQWAEALYTVPEPLADSLKAQAAAFTRGLSSEADKAVALLQFVQQEVRYLGMELGAGSYRPTPPAEVLARRFGDCKDKTLLFCTLMRAAGLTAYPALVHTDYRDKIEGWLPSPHAFNHVIVCIRQKDGTEAWVDPTLSYQKGELGCRSLPDYRRALVIRHGESRLTVVNVPQPARSSLRVTEQFDIPTFVGPAKLRVTSVYSGLSADSTRRYFAQTAPEQITKDYVNYYASMYADITSAKPPSLTEDPRRNLVTVEEAYEVPGIWQKVADGKKLKAEFYPKYVADYAVRPDRIVRAMPLGIRHPVKVQMTTTVNLPEDWTVTPEDIVTEEYAFRAKQKITGQGKVVTMSYSWESLNDHVPVERVPKHVEAINHLRDSLGYHLTYTKPVAADAAPPAAPPVFRLNWLLVLVTLVTLAIAGHFALKLARRPLDPPPLVVVDQELAGIGGWLVLVALGVTLRPFLLLFQIVPVMRHSFNQDVWEAMTIPGRAAYQAGLGPLIMSELVCNLLVLVGSLLVSVLFYRRSRLFPSTYVTVLGFNLVFLALDEWVTPLWIAVPEANPTTTGLSDFVKLLIPSLIWIPYMLVSRRVRATFTR